MVTSLLECETILVTGATSGLGLAMAKRFLEDAAAPGRPAKRLIVTGRRKDKLDELVNAYGAERVVAVPFDISKVDELHTFTADVLAAFGGALDGVVLNAGMQRQFDFKDPSSVAGKLKMLQEEVTTNYTSQVALVTHLLPALIARAQAGKPSSLNVVTSGLSLVPKPDAPNYCATKAALHQFVLVVRHQMAQHSEQVAKNLSITEIMPPLVESELHDSKHQPGQAFDKHGHPSFAMSQSDYIKEVWAGYNTPGGPPDEIAVGGSKSRWELVDQPRKNIFEQMFGKK